MTIPASDDHQPNSHEPQEPGDDLTAVISDGLGAEELNQIEQSRYQQHDEKSLGAWLRWCAGVDESLMRLVWPVRHQYSCLGGIVLGTAIVAAFSMTVALSLTPFGLRWYLMIVPLIWGLFVFNLDRWLVSSTHGVGGKWKLLPRLAVAILFGFIIAEPLVLWIFNDAVEDHIATSRDEEVARSVTLLKECNPEDDIEQASTMRSETRCEGFIVTRTIPSLTLVRPPDQITQLEREVSQLEDRLVPIEDALTEARSRYQREIRGEDGAEVTGRRGIGPVARAIQEEIVQLEDEQSTITNDIQSRQTTLNQIIAEYDLANAADETGRRQAQQIYTDETSKAVAKRIAEVEELNSAPIGFLQRFEALSELANSNSHIFAARWLLTIFLISIDSMPVIAKAVSTRSGYDELYSKYMTATKFRNDRDQSFIDIEHSKELDLQKFQHSQNLAVRRKRASTTALAELLQLDDQVAEMHKERDLPYTRQIWDATDGAPRGMPLSIRPRSPNYDERPPVAFPQTTSSRHDGRNGFGQSESPESQTWRPYSQFPPSNGDSWFTSGQGPDSQPFEPRGESVGQSNTARDASRSETFSSEPVLDLREGAGTSDVDDTTRMDVPASTVRTVISPGDSGADNSWLDALNDG